MRQAAADPAGHQIAGLPVRGGEFVTMSLEPGLDVWHAAMINVAIGARQAPSIRIGTEVCSHVLMNMGLEIKLERFAIGANDDIDADAAISRHVAIRIVQGDIGRVVKRGDTDLLTRMDDQAGGLGFMTGCNARQ